MGDCATIIRQTLKRMRHTLANGYPISAERDGEWLSGKVGCPHTNGYSCQGVGDFQDDDLPVTHCPAACWVAVAEGGKQLR